MYQRMLDKNITPSYHDLAEHCGISKERFLALNEWLQSVYHTSISINFPYGNSYGWCVTHRIKKKLICHVFAEADSYTVMIRCTNQQYNTVYPSISKEAQAIIDQKYPCGDGGWVHFRVKDAKSFQDIQAIIVVKFQ